MKMSESIPFTLTSDDKRAKQWPGPCLNLDILHPLPTRKYHPILLALRYPPNRRPRLPSLILPKSVKLKIF